MLTLLAAGPTDALDPSEWEGLSRQLGPAMVLAFIVVLSACAVALHFGFHGTRALFGKDGLVKKLFTRFDVFLTNLETMLGKTTTQHQTQVQLCEEMKRVHEPGGRCDVGPLIQAMHPAASAAQKIADRVGADIEDEVREIHAALDRRTS